MHLESLVLKAISHVMYLDDFTQAPSPETFSMIFRTLMRTIGGKYNGITTDIELTQYSSRERHE